METNTTSTASPAILTSVNTFATKVYLWMTAGLVVTAISSVILAYFTQQASFQRILLAPGTFLVLILVQLGIVIALSGLINKLSGFASIALFFAYCAFQGVFFGGIIFYAYEINSIAITFAATAGTFGLVSLYGITTGADLTRWGNLAIMGLIGIIVASVINIFAQNTGLAAILNYLGILIFIVLIAYDSQKIKSYAEYAEQTGKQTQMAVIAAFGLYLDFINFFIRLLQLFGKRR